MLTFQKLDNIPDAYVYDTGIDGPICTIIGGIHGDEKCGVDIYKWLIDTFAKHYSLSRGKLYVILGNPKAIGLNKRYFEEDLNRLFDSVSSASYEYHRANKIKMILEKTDYLIDIHSTSSPSEPMTCSAHTAGHIDICSALGVEYVTTGWKGIVNGEASDECVDRYGGIGITLECGNHTSKNAFEFGKQAILKFFNYLDLIDSISVNNVKNIKIIKIVDTIYPETTNFEFVVDKSSFVEIKKGKVYAVDGEKKYIAEQNCVVVMPTKVVKVGIEVCMLGIIE